MAPLLHLYCTNKSIGPLNLEPEEPAVQVAASGLLLPCVARQPDPDPDPDPDPRPTQALSPLPSPLSRLPSLKIGLMYHNYLNLTAPLIDRLEKKRARSSFPVRGPAASAVVFPRSVAVRGDLSFRRGRGRAQRGEGEGG